MIIAIATNNTVAIEEPEDFRKFKVAVAQPASAYEAVAKSNPEIVAFDDAETAWVSVAALKGWEGLKEAPAWQEGLDAMIEKARPYGWISPDGRSIKAHVEWLG